MATCCVTLAGIARDCKDSAGGIKRVWIACFDDVTAKTVSGEEITALTLATGATGFKEYRFRKETGSLTMNIQTDRVNGTSYWENDLVLQFTKLETAKRIEIQALVIGDTVVIVEDNNGKYWYLGYDEPVDLSEGTGETGTAWADFNGYNITLQDISKEHPYEVTQAVIDKISGVTPAP